MTIPSTDSRLAPDRDAPSGQHSAVNVASSLLFESPLEIFRRVYRELRGVQDGPAIDLDYKAFSNPDSRISLKDRVLSVRITDVLQDAPAPVTEALAHILLGKLYRDPAPREYERRYRLYMNRRDVRRRIALLRVERGRKVHRGARGITYNLEEVFEDLNRRFFGGMMARPDLGWSYVRSRTRLGHYDPSHHMIMISRIFDDPRTPRVALDYVMFHEMLHLRYPVDHSGARRCVHTPEFKAHEKQFPYFVEAKALLRKLC